MGYEILIDNKFKVKPKNGFIYKDELTDTLDSATITFIAKESHTLNHQKIKLDVESFDRVEITGSLNNGNAISKKILLVDKLHNDITNPFRTDAVCNYRLDLFSQTKELERKTLPNLSITSAKNPINNKSVYYYIDLYMNLYAPKIRRLTYFAQTPNDYDLYPKYSLSSALVSRFLNITCPELQWNNPTLREVLTDLMMVDNCIPVVRDNELSFIDLSKKGNQIDKTKLNGYHEDMTSADYCSELTLPISNSIGNQIVNREEYIGWRDESQAQLTTENLVLRTSMPIYEINKIYIYGLVTYARFDENAHATYYGISKKIDITPYIMEKRQYDVLPEFSNYTEPSVINNFGTKLGHIYYERGKNTIKGFLCSSENYNPFRLWFKDYIASFPQDMDAQMAFDFRTAYFKIEYKTQDDRKIIAGKYLRTKHAQNQIFDAQTSSYVNPEKMSIYEYLKVNRLGNKIITINGIYTDENDVPKLGDKLDDKVIFARTIQYYDEYIIFEGQLTENYILKNFFTSVMAKKRSWAYVEGSDALTRHDVDKYYAELSYIDKPYKLIDKHLQPRGGLSSIENGLLSPFWNYQPEPLKYAIVSFYHGTSSSASTGLFVLDTSVEKMGDSIAITYQTQDNYAIDMYLRDTGGGGGLDLLNEFYKYVDDEGRVSKFETIFASGVSAGDDVFQWLIDTEYGDPETTWNQQVAKSFEKPLVRNTGNYFGFRFGHGSGVGNWNPSVYKDNAEIFKRTFQIEFCSDTKEIIVGDRFITLQRFISKESNDPTTFKLYWSGTAPLLNDRNYIPSNAENIYLTRIDYNLNEFNIQWTTSKRGGYAYLTDANDKLILAFNLHKRMMGLPAEQTSQNMFINLLELRDDTIYGLDGKTVVGDIINGVNS